jgi:hypothetical protein
MLKQLLASFKRLVSNVDTNVPVSIPQDELVNADVPHFDSNVRILNDVDGQQNIVSEPIYIKNIETPQIQIEQQ